MDKKKVFAVKPEDLSWISGTHMVEGQTTTKTDDAALSTCTHIEINVMKWEILIDATAWTIPENLI